jgi:hypothetical protein
MMEVLMARRKLTDEEMAAKVAKMKATKAANKAKALEALGLKTERKKVRKSRKMTDEQKKAAAARLAKARANRGPSQNKMIAETVRNLPDENPLSLVNVRSWIKENKELLQSIRDFKTSKDWKQRDTFTRTQTYVANLEAYLRDGFYRDLFYGSQMQNKIIYRVTTMAYHKDGTPKRTVGYMYPDVGIYTQEMANEDNAAR